MSANREQRGVFLARRLDARQRAILRMLYDHKVLLTHQIKVLFFAATRTAQAEMKKLRDLKLVDREELTENGVQVVAVMLRKPRSSLEWMPRKTWLESDRHLDHDLGVNRFFVSLVEASFSQAGHGLEKWVPARYITAREAGAWIKPDGFGRYHHPEEACDFYLEFDRATEWKRQLIDKLFGYLRFLGLWREGGAEGCPNLLVVVPTEFREGAFDRALAELLDRLELHPKNAVMLPFFIASEELLHHQGVLGKVWRRFVPPPKDRPLGPALLAERASIVELPAKLAGPFDLERCLGREWTEKGRSRRGRRPRRPPTYPSGKPPAPPAGDEEGDAPGGGEAA